MKKIISFLLVLLISSSLVACKNYADKEFEDVYVKATKDRWIENSENNKNSQHCDKSYYYERSKILSNEINKLKSFKEREFQDKKLKKILIEYISIVTEEKKLSDLGFEDKFKPKDVGFEDLLWIKRVKIYKTLHDDYKFPLDDKEYKAILDDYNKHIKLNKERSTPLANEQKKEYSNDISFDNLIENEEKLLDKKIILKGEVGSVHLDANDLYFNFYVNGDYDDNMFIFYKKDILSRNIKEGDSITCYIDYSGLTAANTPNDTLIQIPEGWARYIEFK